MRRGTPLKRAALKSGLTRKPLRQRSAAQVDDSVRQASVRAEVFARDGHRCVIAQYKGIDKGAVIHGEGVAPIYLPACGGRLTFGHRRHAGAGGAYVVANGACVCQNCNDFCADNADDIRAIFGTRLIVRESDPEWTELGRRAQGVR